MKISFDFDSTLSRKAVQKFAKALIQNGHEIHIVTSRFENPMRYNDPIIIELGHRDMFNVCKYLGIPRERIHFTNMKDKYHFFQEHTDFYFHLDDDEKEVALINEHTFVKGYLCDFKSNWKEELKKGLQ